MARRKPQGNSNHEGGGRSNYDEELEQENENRQEGASVKNPFVQGFRDYRDYSVGQDHYNPWTERGEHWHRGKKDYHSDHTLEHERANRWKKNKFWAAMMDIRDIGVLSKMDSGEVFARDEKGNLKHSDYMIRMWNRVQNAQTAMKSVGTGAQIAADMPGAYLSGFRSGR